MGDCLSVIFGRRNDASASGDTKSSAEMANRSGGDVSESLSESIKMDPSMSSPSIKIHANGISVSGTGLALAGTSVEQDSAYWEWEIEDADDGDNKLFVGGLVKFGVSTRKNSEFYQSLKNRNKEDASDNTIEDEESQMTVLMRALPKLCYGDTVGVAVQQSDLPMIQFLHNGEWMPDLAIHRFRGSVFPSIFISRQAASEPKFRAVFRFLETDFQHRPPNSSNKLAPLITARSLV